MPVNFYDMEEKVRHVASPKGVAHFGLPIGSPILPGMKEGQQALNRRILAASKAGSTPRKQGSKKLPYAEGDRVRYHQAPGGLMAPPKKLVDGEWTIWTEGVVARMPGWKDPDELFLLDDKGRYYGLKGHVVEKLGASSRHEEPEKPKSKKLSKEESDLLVEFTPAIKAKYNEMVIDGESVREIHKMLRKEGLLDSQAKYLTGKGDLQGIRDERYRLNIPALGHTNKNGSAGRRDT